MSDRSNNNNNNNNMMMPSGFQVVAADAEEQPRPQQQEQQQQQKTALHQLIAKEAATRIRRFEMSRSATSLSTSSSLEFNHNDAASVASSSSSSGGSCSSSGVLDDDLTWDQMEVGKLLGEGSFSVVRSTRIRHLSRHQTFAVKSIHPDLLSSMTLLSSSEAKKDVRERQEAFAAGLVDLAVEAKILSKLSHKNIIQLVGVSSGGKLSHQVILSSATVASNSLRGQRNAGFFLVEECLMDTLDRRLDLWKTEQADVMLLRSSSHGGGEMDGCGGDDDSVASRRLWWGKLRAGQGATSGGNAGGTQLLRNLQETRLLQRLETVVLGIVRGMEYLHKHQIIFRDLKPSNIGFGTDGRVRIFDFGLAREVSRSSRKTNINGCGSSYDHAGEQSSLQQRKMTANCGTPRYMAPEVAHGQQYGLPADVHSFAILLWEIVTLEKPFDHIASVRDLWHHVFGFDAERPSLSKAREALSVSPVSKAKRIVCRDLLERSWHVNPAQRPTFNEIRILLEESVIARMEDALDRRHRQRRRRLVGGVGGIGGSKSSRTSMMTMPIVSMRKSATTNVLTTTAAATMEPPSPTLTSTTMTDDEEDDLSNNNNRRSRLRDMIRITI